MLFAHRFTLVAFAAAVAASLLSVGPTAAQDLFGHVTTEEHDPLAGVQIVLPDIDRGTVSGADGRFRIRNLPAGEHVVAFRYVGFSTHVDTITVDREDVHLDVILRATTIELDDTVISAEAQPESVLKRSSRSVSVLDPDDLRAIRGQTLGETLQKLPGVQSMTTGPSISKPVIRGLHSQRLVVMNAGVPQEGQQWGGEHAPEIDPFSAGHIEVIRGAAGVEYGIGAIGGVIRIEPAPLPEQAGLAGEIALNAYSNNRQGAVSGMAEDKSGPVAWRFRGTLRKAGAARTPQHVIGNSGFQESDAAITLGTVLGPVDIGLHASHFGTTLGLYSGAHIGNFDDLLRAIERGEPLVDYEFSYDIEPPKQTIRHDLISLDATYRLPWGDALEARYGFQSNRRAEFDAHTRFGSSNEEPAFSLDLETHTADLSLQQKPRVRWTGSSGISFMTQGNFNGESGFLIPNFRANTAGIYTRQSYVQDAVTIDTGLRLDMRSLTAYPREDRTRGEFVRREHRFTGLSAVTGIIWRFTEHWSLSSNAGLAWRPPGVNELYNFGVHHGTAQFEIGNPDLHSERSYNLDATVRHVSLHMTAEVSVYRNQMDGYIHLFPEDEPRVTIRGTFPSFRYAQSDAVLTGVDGAFEYDVLTDRLTLGASASVVRGTDVERDRPLIFMPSDRFAGFAEWTFPTAGPLVHPTVMLEARHSARQDRVPTEADFAPPPDSYTLFSAGLSTDVDLGMQTPASVSLNVDNLFDTTYRDYMSRYRYFIGDPGRNVIVRMTVPIG